MNRIHRGPETDLVRPWEDRPVTYERWCHHQDLLMRSAGPGRRPVEWWLFEQHMDAPALDDQAAVLLAMGELAEHELKTLMVWWRDAYERACEPGMPSQARKWHLRGIPPAIVKQWNAKRRRPSAPSADPSKGSPPPA
jgi:hypothetical protein